MKSPSKPKEDPSAAVMRERQIEMLAEQDEEMNRKIKAMRTSARGSRMFRNSPASRGLPSNTSGRPMYAARGSGGGGVSGGAGAPGYGGGSKRGGANRLV